MLGVVRFFFSSRRRHTRCSRDWSSDVCSSDLVARAVAVAYDADVASGGRREGVALELEGLPAALAGEDRGPGDGVERHLDVEVRDAGVAHVPGDVHLIKGCDRAEVVADPLAVALRRPAGGEVAVNGILGDVAIIRARGHCNQGKRDTVRSDD